MEGLNEKLVEWGAQYGMKLIGALVILIIGRLVVGIVGSVLKRMLKKLNVDETLRQFVLTVTRITLSIFVVLAALSTVGVETTSFIAVIGAAGLAVGLALQGSLANFASGVLLIAFRPLKTGDLVEAGGHLGVIKEVHIFNTIMLSLDNKRVIIPNSKVTGDSIVNYSAEGFLRVDMVFGISYGDNISQAKKILEEILAGDARVLKDPPFTVAVSELGDSSVNFVVRPYVKVEDYWGVYFGVTETVKRTFDDQGVSIPFPQRDVHMRQALTSPMAG